MRDFKIMLGRGSKSPIGDVGSERVNEHAVISDYTYDGYCSPFFFFFENNKSAQSEKVVYGNV